MTSVSWSSALSGNWTTGSNWQGGSPPGTSDDAFIAVVGNYTVSLTTPLTVASLTVSDTLAALQIQDTGGIDTISGNLDNSGNIGVDAIGAGGSTLTIGGTLTNNNGLQVGNGNMTAAALLTVGGVFNNTGGVTIAGGQAGAAARLVVAGASPGVLIGTYNIVANAGTAAVQWGSGGITQVGDGASNGADLLLDGAEAFAAVGATDSNSALTNLGTIASNGLVDLRDGVTVATAGSLTVAGGGRLKVDAYGGSGGSDVTIGGDLANASSGDFGVGGVAVGSGNITSGDTLTVNGVVDNAGGVLTITGGHAGATARMIVTGAASGPLTGQYNVAGGAGGAVLQYGSGAITQIGDGANNGGGLFIDGANTFVEVGATDSNSALDSLSTIAGNGILDLRDDVTVTTTGNLTVLGGDGRLKVDAYGGAGGSDVTVGGNLANSSFGNFGDGGVSVGNGNMTVADTLTVHGTFNNTGGLLTLNGGQSGATARMVVTGAVAATLTGQYNIVGGTAGASLRWGSGGVAQIGDGASSSAYLYIDGSNAFAEIGATNSNNALNSLGTINGNGVLDLRDDVTVSTTGGVSVLGGDGRLKIDAYGGHGGSDLSIGGNLSNSSFGNFGDGGVSVGNGNMTVGDTLTVHGAFDNTGGLLTLNGGQSGAAANMIVTAAVAATLTGQYNIVGATAGASLRWGSGGIAQIGDGGSNSGYLYIDGSNAFAEIGNTNGNNALDSLGTINGNGVLDLRDDVTVTTTGGVTVLGGDGRLKVDAYGGHGGSDVTIGGNLANSSFGNFSDGGVSVGNGNMTVGDTLTVHGTFDNTGGLLTVNGGQSGASAKMVVTGAVAATLTGNYSVAGNAGGASLQYGSGGIVQIGDGGSNGADIAIDGSNAFVEVGATNSNNALDSLGTINGNGLLDLRDDVQVSTTGNVTVLGGDGRLKVDAYGGHGGSDVTIGSNLSNSSFGNFSDGGVSVGNGNMTVADTLTVHGTFDNTGGLLTVNGGQSGAAAKMVVTGAVAATLIGNYNIVGNAGGASLQYGSGAIAQIGDGASNGADLAIDGSNAFAEVGATNSNNALSALGTIHGNGLLDLRDDVTVSTTGDLTVLGGDGRLKVDAYGGHGGSKVTIGGNLTNGSSGNFSDGGVSVGNGNMTVGDTLAVHGTVDNTGGILDVTGGLTAAATARLIVTGAVQSTLTGTYNIVGDTGGAIVQWGAGGITKIGDGNSNGADLVIDGANAFAEVGATNSNSALTGLATIAANGVLDVRDGATIATTGSLTVDGSTGRLKVDAYGGNGGSDVTIGGDLENASPGAFGDGGVAVGRVNMTTGDTLSINGNVKNDAGALLDVTGNSTTAAATGILELTGAFNNAGGVNIGGNGDIILTGASAYTQSGGFTAIAGTLTTSGSIAVNGGTIQMSGGSLVAGALDIAAGASLAGFGTVATKITSAGSIIASGGSLDLTGGLTTASPITIANGSALELAGADSGDVTFTGAGDAFVLDDPIGFTGTISGLAVTDTLVLRNTKVTGATATFNAGSNTSTLVVNLVGGGTLNFTLAGDYSGEAFGATLVGSDTQIGALGAAVGQIDTPLPVALGTVRQGTNATVPISITNNSPAGSAALDVTVGAATGGAFGAGTIVALAPGATDATDITVGIGNGIAGVQTGTVTLDFASDLGSGNEAPLPSAAITVSGTVYREAIATIAPLVLFAHVGDPGVETLNVGNIATADGFSEDLIATLTGATGNLTVAGGSTTGDIAAGASNAAALTLDFSTTSAGVLSGNALVSLLSDGGTGAGSIDGLGTIALPSQAVPIVINVNNFATADLEAPTGFGTLTANGNAETLDLGTIAENSGPFGINFGVANSATGPADVLSGSFVATAANGFSLSGLGAFAGLAAGQTITPGVTLDTTTAGVVTQTITLEPTDSNAGGFNQALAAQTLTVTGTVMVLPPPVITAASTLTAMTAVPSLLGLSVGDPNIDTLPLTVTISDGSGALTAQTSGHATVTGSGTNKLTLTGNLAELNEELATVAYAGAAVGTDTINVGIIDQHHASASRTINVGVVPVPATKPIFNSPATVTSVVGAETGYGGLSISDPGAQASGEIVTIGFIAPSGTLTITGGYGGTIIGQGTGTLAVIGTVNQINQYLGDGLLGDIGNSLGGIAFGTLQGFIRHGTITAITPENLVTLGGGPEGKFFELGVASAAFAINALIGLIPGNTPPSRADFIKTLVNIIGDPHIVAANGAIYDFNAEGEFVLAAATQPGDSFDVQVRLESFNNSPYASSVTQVGAQLGTDRITFGTGRSDIFWVDGSAAAIGASGTLALSGGVVTQISDSSYRVSWNTGEVLNVTNAGKFLDVSIAPGPNNDVGSLVGLATLADTPADEFQLVDGSILQAPLSSATLYGPYADSWRVPQADSLLDYAPGQTTATFTNSNFPAADITLANLPASVVAQAAAAVAAAGIIDPGAAAAIEFDYIVSGGDPAIVAADASFLSGVATAPVQATPSGPAPVAIGVMADQAQVKGDNTTTTAVVFDAYLTGTRATDEVINYAVVASSATDLDAAAFGGTFPSGQVTIAAGQVSNRFTIDVPAGALALNPDSILAVQVTPTDSTPLFAPNAQATIVQAIPGPPALPVLQALTNFGTFTGSGTSYQLDLGDVQYGEPLPTLRFAIENGAKAPSDLLSGTFDVAPVEGFSVTGATLPAPLNGGDRYQGLNVTVNSIKFGPNDETIVFTPTDSNITGFREPLSPITLTIKNTIVKPTMVFSYAWGDVHIVTYNGLMYDFQGEGEFTLAKSRIPGDSFDIQMRLQPWSAGASVTVITQVAVSVGTDKVTFDQSRPDTVFVDGNPSTISAANPTVNLNGGSLTQIDTSTWQVKWDTGEEATITGWGKFFNISDGIPLSEPNKVGGLQGQDAGAANDFQLSDGTVLQQPLPATELYGEFADSWRVAQNTSLFDYLPGQTTNTFTDLNFPGDVVKLTDLPASVVAPATDTVAKAGISDVGIAQAAQLDYIATGDPTFVQAAQQVQTLVTNTTPVNTPNDLPIVPAVGVQANPVGYIEAASGPTTTTFNAYLTRSSANDVVVNYAVIAAGAGFADAATFGGTLPSGSVTIAAGATLVPFTIDLPANALGTSPEEKLEVQVTAPGGSPVFAPQAIARINNNSAEPGVAPIPHLLKLTNVGTLIEVSPTAYTLNLGTLTQGQTVAQVQLGIANQASPPADSLSGTFGAPIGTGFLVVGNSLPGAIIAGQQYDGLYVAPQTTTAGPNTETLVFNATDVNGSGFVAPLLPITLTIIDTVVPTGVGQLNTPQTIVFQNVHVGTAESQSLNVSNTGAAPISVAVSAVNPIIALGTIASLAAGVTDTTNLSVGVDTSSAGAQSGIVNVNFGATAPQIDVFGDVFRLASGTVAPISAFLHVGDTGTIALDISNTATADGFSENLLGTLASFTGNLGIAAGGPTGEIAAGSSDTSSLLLDFSTSQAGTITGTATIDLTSDGGTGTGSIDGLGTTALAPQAVPVAVAIDNFATAAFENLSAIGSFSQSGTAYSLDLGTVAQGSGTLSVALGVLNAATGLADALSGSLTVAGSGAFANSGTAAFSGLGAGQADTAPVVTLNTDSAGTFSETITLAATGSNGSGFSGALPDQVLTITGTVAALTFAAAAASISPASPINLGNVHVGDAADQTLNISNTATAGAASLDGSVKSQSGDASGTGTFTGLAPGAAASTAISVGIDTSAAGAKNGSVSLAFVSDDGAGGVAGLPDQAISVLGTVYRKADATLVPISEIVHVGDPGTAKLSVSNSSTPDGFSESLIAALLGGSSGIGIATPGPTGDILAGASDTSSLGISFSTAQAGTIDGTATVGLTSDGGTGASSIDGLGQSALPDQSVAVNITVDNFANSKITSDGNLTSVGTNSFKLDLGSTLQGSAALLANLSSLNDVVGPADSLSGTAMTSGDSEFSNTGFGALGTVDAGALLALGNVALSTSTAGVFTETVTLTPTDSNTSGFSEALAPQTVTVVGTIVPVATALGDVHMMTFDGLRYDFQAVGSYILTRSTTPGDRFEIQMQTAADAAYNAVSFNVLEAAHIGSDIVTFGIDRDSMVWLNGKPDTALNAATPVQTLDGGTLTWLSDTSFQLNWTTGQSVAVADRGPYLDSSVTLGSATGGVEGLLGTANGNTADDFQLPNGTVLQQPLSDQVICDTLGGAWSVTTANSLLGGDAMATSAADPTIAPVTAATLGTDPAQFVHASGPSMMQASAKGQVLNAASGAGVLSDAGGFGATFQGTLAQFARVQLTGLSAKDLIDITDLGSTHAMASYTRSGAAGVLKVSNATQSGELHLSSQIAGATFQVAADGHGGSLISFH